jgi:sugar/nucleoside kinase (ribokinase family)
LAGNLDLIIVGSVALDTVQSPAGSVREALGGSAVYGSLAASFFCRAGIVAVVGEDFCDGHRSLLQGRGVDIAGLAVERGKTFRWKGVYSDDFSSRTTLETCLNVFADFRPELPQAYRTARFLFLGNISPELQDYVLSQMVDVELVVMDTMNFWIESDRTSVLRVMERCHGVALNDEEARSLSGQANLVKASRFLLDRGPQFAILKKGEHGCMVAAPQGLFCLPAYPVEDVSDPTGAGDSFAGGFLGYLAQSGQVTWERLKEAAAAGTAVASCAVEGFSVDGLKRATASTLRERMAALARLCRFDPPIM